MLVQLTLVALSMAKPRSLGLKDTRKLSSILTGATTLRLRDMPPAISQPQVEQVW